MKITYKAEVVIVIVLYIVVMLPITLIFNAITKEIKG